MISQKAMVEENGGLAIRKPTSPLWQGHVKMQHVLV